jgi:hypothetical protein
LLIISYCMVAAINRPTANEITRAPDGGRAHSSD